jgi:predicted PurR-regulated permease PerM
LVFRYFLALFLLSGLLVARLMWPFISILLLSFMLTGIFLPVFSFLQRGLPKAIASLLTCCLIFVLVFVPLFSFIGALSKEAIDFYQLSKGTNINLKLHELLQESTILPRLQEIIAEFGYKLQPEVVTRMLSDLAKMVGPYLFNQASSWATDIMTFILDFFMMLLIIFFLLIDHDKLTNFVLRLSPLPDNQERHLIHKFQDIAGAVLVVNGFCGFIQGVCGGLVFIFFGFGSPILWGGIMGMLAFLPIFGIGLVMVPAALMLLLRGEVGSGMLLFIFYILLSFSIEYVAKPMMLGGRVKMHTLLVFLSIITGLSVFGLLGIIYGPLIVTAFLTLADIYLADYDPMVKKQGTESS